MWYTVLVLALMAAPDPVRLGIVVLLFSRRQPLRNLFVYWLGALATGTVAALGMLLVLRNFAPIITEHMAAAAASSTVRHMQVVCGVLALPVAVLIARGFSLNQRAQLPVAAGGPPSLVLPENAPTPFSRLFGRVQNAVGGGCLWVAFGAGLGSGPPPVECTVAFTAISASGAAVGTQVGAVAAYLVVMLAIVEIPLISYLARPAETEAVMLQLRNWLQAHRRRFFAVIVAVAGVALMASGMGNA